MTAQKSTLRAVFDGFRDPLVLTLGLTQTIGYGTLFYAYGVLAQPIAASFAVSLDLFFALFTAGLLLGGLAAPLVGRAIDKRGARRIMIGGSLMASTALMLCAAAPNIWVFGFAVIVMEFAACMVLYEAAFTALTQVYRHEARSRITAITLIAGFASTVFWPLTQWLSVTIDWRMTWAVYAALNCLVCLPLHFFMLGQAKPLAAPSETPETRTAEPAILAGTIRSRAILLYAAAIALSGIVYSAIPIHMLNIIASRGFDASTAALIATLMGPAQVAARVVEVLAGNRFDALITGRVALLALPIALVLLMLSGVWAIAIFLFPMVYGVSQGLISIARGTVQLQLFGVKGYGTLQGRITGLRFFLNALAPLAFAFIATRAGMDWATAACLATALIACLAFFLLPRPIQPAA